MSINSSKEKVALAKWLYCNDERSYQNPRKLQKFLFFYEAFSKVMGEPYDLGKFRIWINGPVESVLYGDYTYRGSHLIKAMKKNHETVQEDIAKRASFLVQILNTKEISELSHKFDYWKKPANQYGDDELRARNVAGHERDFSEKDFKMAKELFDLYDTDFIENSVVVHTLGKHFVMSKNDFENLSEEQQEVLDTLSEDNSLMNPVFVEIDDDGSLLVD